MTALHVITVGGNHPIDFTIPAPTPAQVEALAILSARLGHIVTPVDTVEVLVEVDVATARPPRVHARTYTWIAVTRHDRHNVAHEAEHTAMEMASCHPHVVMVVGARTIDWRTP